VLLILLAVLFLAGAAYLLGEAATADARDREVSVKRAANYGKFRAALGTREQPFRDRVIEPAIERLAKLVLRIHPKTNVDGVRGKLLAAGLGHTVSPAAFLAAKAAVGIGGLVFGLALGAVAGGVGLLLGIALGVVGFLAPDFVVGARARKRRHETAFSGRVTRIQNYRQVCQLIERWNRGDIAGVPRSGLKRANAPLAQNHIRISMRHDVLRGHQQLFHRAAHATLQQHRTAAFSQRLEQDEILHVARADLHHVGVLGDQIDVAVAHHLGDNGQAGSLLGLLQQLEPFDFHALKIVRRSARLERAAAQQLGSSFGHGFGSLLRRDFTGGIVLVNPPGAATQTVALPAAMRDVAGNLVQSVTLPAASGAVAMNSS